MWVSLWLSRSAGRVRTVIGFDINAERVRELQAGNDTTREVDPGDLNHKTLTFTSDPSQLKAADFFIVTVPTPIDDARRPDLTRLVEGLCNGRTRAEVR